MASFSLMSNISVDGPVPSLLVADTVTAISVNGSQDNNGRSNARLHKLFVQEAGTLEELQTPF